MSGPPLDPGESEAVQRAVQLSGKFLIADDRDARRCGERLELHAVGTLGIIVRAGPHRRISEVAPIFRNLAASNLFASQRVIRHLLALADESPDALMRSADT